MPAPRPLPLLALLALAARAAAAQEPPPDPWRAPPRPETPALFYERFETWTAADGLPSDKVTCVLAEDGALWAGTDQGLAERRGDGWTCYGTGDGLAHRYVTSLARDGAGGLWIATLGGLSHLSGGRFRNYHQLDSGLMNDVVYQVAVDGELVWAATAAGTSCLDTRSGSWALYDTDNTIMHEPWCYSLALGPGRVWIGVWGGGVVELDRTSGLWREYRDPDGEMELDLIRDDGPIHDVTAFVAYDAGVLWQATYFGLSRYDGRRWRSYLAEDSGLPGNFLNHVWARGHTAWLSSDQGFGVFDGTTCASYFRTEEGGCEVRVWRDGAEVERRALATAPADNYILWAQGGAAEVWLGTGRGLSHGIAAPPRPEDPNPHRENDE